MISFYTNDICRCVKYDEHFPTVIFPILVLIVLKLYERFIYERVFIKQSNMCSGTRRNAMSDGNAFGLSGKISESRLSKTSPSKLYLG